LPSAGITPAGPTIFCAGDSVTLNANSGGGLSYQWKNNGVNISGAVNSNYVADAAGLYKVKVTNANGCKKISAGVTVTVPCRLAESETGNPHVFNASVVPNPSADDFIFSMENADGEIISVAIFNVMGAVVFSEKYFSSPFILRSNQLPPGIFTAVITNGRDSRILKLVKMR
jgi:hypothetical protein